MYKLFLELFYISIIYNKYLNYNRKVAMIDATIPSSDIE